MARKFHISFSYSHGNAFEIAETTYEIDGPVNEALLEDIKYQLMNQMGYSAPPKILGLFELEEALEDEEE